MAKISNQLVTKISNRFGFRQTQADDEMIRKVVEECVQDNIGNGEGNGNAYGALDAIMIEVPAIRDGVNKRLAKAGVKQRLTYKGLGVKEDNGVRVVEQANSDCEVVSCADIIVELYECEAGISDYINTVVGNSTCPTQFPSYIGKLQASVVPEGASAPDLSSAFTVDTANPDTSNLICTTLRPEKYGLRIPVSRERLDCNQCIDIISRILIEAPRMIRRAIDQALVTLIDTASTTLTTPSSQILTVLTEAEKELITQGAEMSRITHFMNPVVFLEYYNTLDAENRPLLNFEIGDCPLEECRRYCIGYHNIIVTRDIPVTGPAGARSSFIHSVGDLDFIVARESAVQSCESFIDGDCLIGTQWSFWKYFVSAIPANLANQFVKTNVVI